MRAGGDAQLHRREPGRLDDLALLMLDVARVRALLAIGNPVGIGFERFAPPLAVGLTLEAPKKYDLVDGPDIGGEDADRLAQMPNMDRHALGLVQFEPGAEAPSCRSAHRRSWLSPLVGPPGPLVGRWRPPTLVTGHACARVWPRPSPASGR